MKNTLKVIKTTSLYSLLIAGLAAPVVADPTPCASGETGKYITWTKTTFRSGRGTVLTPSGFTTSFPDFDWKIQGEPNEVDVETGEPFGGDNSMVQIYGPADSATNLKVRIEGNYRSPGKQISHNAVVVLNFDTPTPASGWGFSVVDIDVDQVRITARNATGQKIPESTLKNWFIQRFDADPVADGVNLPKWDANNNAVIGSSSSFSTLQTKVEGGLEDTEAGSAWFQPTEPLSKLSFYYESLQNEAFPSFHILMAACNQELAPAPTPTPSADDDGDGITNQDEGTDDTDKDGVPDHEDLDSDNDTILDQEEGSDDNDGDTIPNSTDLDSDNDDVLDQIERDPDADPVTPSGQDSDNDGIDDNLEDRTDDPTSDTDSGGLPDYLDTDSDNDTKGDGEEAYDLDGDGDRDIEGSGDDNNENGADDSFEEFTDPEDLGPDYTGEPSTHPCDEIEMVAKKNIITKRLTKLSNRIGIFAAKAKACGNNSLSGIANRAPTERDDFIRAMDLFFNDVELLCELGTCSRIKKQSDKDTLNSLAYDIYRNAKRAKLTAGSACNITHVPDPSDNRPTTDDYLSALQAAINQLPSRISRCE